MSLQSETLKLVIHDPVISLALNGFERIYFLNGHGGNIRTFKAAFDKIFATALERNLRVAKKLRCKLRCWFLVPEIYKLANKIYGEEEGSHATPSEIAFTLYLQLILLSKHRPFSDLASSGVIND